MKNRDPLEFFFRETVSRLREARIPFWLEFGALLGFVREGSLLSWDRDIDLGLWRGDATEETLINLFEGDPFTLSHDPESDCLRIRPKDGIIPAFVDLDLYRKISGRAVLSLRFSKLTLFERFAALMGDALAGREHDPHESPALARIQRGLYGVLHDKVAPLLPHSLRHRLETYPRTLRDRTKAWAVYEFPARLFRGVQRDGAFRPSRFRPERRRRLPGGGLREGLEDSAEGEKALQTVPPRH